MDITQLSDYLQRNVRSSCRTLFSAGREIDGRWYVAPEQEDGASIDLTTGAWSYPAAQQSGNDLIYLFCRFRKQNLAEALTEIKNILGLDAPEFANYSPRLFVRPRYPQQMTAPADDGERYLRNAGLTQETVRSYRIGWISDSRSLIFPYFRGSYLVNYVTLPIKTRSRSMHEKAEPCLFGWSLLPECPQRVVLVADEISCMILHQYGVAALSLPPHGGAGINASSWLECDYEYLRTVKEFVFYLPEMAPDKMVMLARRLGADRCKQVPSLPYRSLEDCVKHRLSAAHLHEAISNACDIAPHELRSASYWRDRLIRWANQDEADEQGVYLPWAKTHRYIKLRPGEYSLWTGYNGHGKTTALSMLPLSNASQGVRTCMASFEIDPFQLLKRMSVQAAGIENPTPKYVEAINSWMAGNIFIFDLQRSVNAKRLFDVFYYAHRRYGIDHFIIDSLMRCGMSEKDYDAHAAFIEQLCDFKNDLRTHVHLVAHPKKFNNEDGGEREPPGRYDVKGPSTISDAADNAFIWWRNKKKEEELRILKAKGIEPSEELLSSPDNLFICEKQRVDGEECRFSMWYQAASKQFLSQRGERPRQYVDFSSANAETILQKKYIECIK